MANTLINVELFKGGVESALGGKKKLRKFVDSESVEGLQAHTVNVITNEYVGDATVLAQGSAIPVTDLVQTETPVTFKHIGKGVRVFDTELKQKFGDVLGNAEKQTVSAIDGAMESEVAELLKKATFKYEYDSVEGISADVVLEAIGVMGEAIEDAEYFIVVNPADLPAIQRGLVPDARSLNGTVYGAKIEMSSRVEKGKPYLVQFGAIKEFVQKETDVEPSRDASKKATEIYTDKIYGAYIQDASRLVAIAPSV